jgi:hypothetical protein
MIRVTRDGVIYDGHHCARAAAEAGRVTDVLVIGQQVPASGLSLLGLPVR